MKWNWLDTHNYSRICNCCAHILTSLVTIWCFSSGITRHISHPMTLYECWLLKSLLGKNVMAIRLTQVYTPTSTVSVNHTVNNAIWMCVSPQSVSNPYITWAYSVFMSTLPYSVKLLIPIHYTWCQLILHLTLYDNYNFKCPPCF